MAPTQSTHSPTGEKPLSASPSVFQRVYTKLFTLTAPDSALTKPDNSADLAAAEEGRHGYTCKSPKLDIMGSPRLCWEAFQAMRQVGVAETRLMSDAEVEQLCSPRLS